MGGFRGFWGSPGTPPPFEKCISGRFPGARRPGFFGVTRATKRRRPERAKAGFAGQKGPLQAPLMCTIGRTGAEFAGPCWVRGAKGFAAPFMCTIGRTGAEFAPELQSFAAPFSPAGPGPESPWAGIPSRTSSTFVRLCVCVCVCSRRENSIKGRKQGSKS